MRTPSGSECSYYYEDFNRGAEITRCRVKRGRGSAPWRARQCKRCPVPLIEAHNGDPRLDITLTVHARPFGLPERFDVEAWCTEHGPIEDPHVGCLECLSEVRL